MILILGTQPSRPFVVLEGHCSVLAALLVGLSALSAESELEALSVHSLDEYDFVLAPAPASTRIPLH